MNTFRLGVDEISHGLVEYVGEYIRTHRPPQIKEYLYKCDFPHDSGEELYLLPSGKKSGYASALAEIDWQELYKEQSGFLFIENMREQWRAEKFDYVLIDSRTGHTEVGGICTRQLPDSVVFLFFPNVQNLEGMEIAVNAVKEHPADPDKKPETIFVASNVPDLDDEDGILASSLRDFATRLGYESVDATIHRYSSLALVNQSIFTRDRPGTRLAREYRELTDVIASRNLEDPKAALDFVGSILDPRRRSTEKAVEVEERLDQITRHHGENPEILFRVGLARERYGSDEEAFILVSQAVDLGLKTPDSLWHLARMCHEVGEAEQALHWLDETLQHEETRFHDVHRTLSLLVRIDDEEIARIADADVWEHIGNDEFALLASQFFQGDLFSVKIGDQIADKLYRSEKQSVNLLNCRMLLKIALGKFEDALNLNPDRPELNSENVAIVFNYAMAEWAVKGRPSRDLFAGVAQHYEQKIATKVSANIAQCVALSHWCIGDSLIARDWLEKAKKLPKVRAREFSSWRYLNVKIGDFQEDLKALGRMFDGEDIQPEVFQRAGVTVRRD